MDFGNGIYTDGPVCGAQATAPGQAVMLGDDLKIPSGFVSGGGSQLLPTTSGDQVRSLINQAEIGTTFTLFGNDLSDWQFTGTKIEEVTDMFYGTGFGGGKLVTCVQFSNAAGIYLCGPKTYGAKDTANTYVAGGCRVLIH